VARLKTRQVVAVTMAATTNPTQYGAVSPNLAAITPPSMAPTQFPPAAMNRLVLATRPSISSGVSRCRNEFATMVHSAACTPNANSMNPTKYALREVARTRYCAVSISNPIRIVQVAVTRLISQSPHADPSRAPAARHVNSVP
jgi:hypothetical protein